MTQNDIDVGPGAHVSLCTDTDALRFQSKFADVEALACGDAGLLRPVLGRQASLRLSQLPQATRRIALVIGGNGFIGSHIIARLAEDPHVERVYALVRQIDGQPGRARIERTLAAYERPLTHGDKLEVLEGTPTAPMFGLSRDVYGSLQREVGALFNCASSSDYAVSYLELRADWVLGLLRVLQFATERVRKHVTYLGSVGAYFYRTLADFRRPDSWWYSGYCQMKWVNGAILRWLAHDDLLPVTLCEAPYVLGSTSRGLDPGRHYSWWRIVEIARSVGAIWEGPGMNYVPVDVLADVLVRNAWAAKPCWHLLPCNPEPYDNTLLASLMDLRVVKWAAFLAEVEARISPVYYRTLLSSNVQTLIARSNRPPVFPPGYPLDWADTRRLYTLYLGRQLLRDVRRRSSRSRVQVEGPP